LESLGRGRAGKGTRPYANLADCIGRALATGYKNLDTSNLMKVIAVIPARLASMRLPRKMLREIHGRPLALWVYQAVRSSLLLDDVILATDSDEVLETCKKHSCKAVMTSTSHRSGTERVHEVSQSVDADVYINVQGDEPMVRADHIAALVELIKNPEVPAGTLKTPAAPEDIANPNAVKVVTDRSGRALYFSRSTLPFDRDNSQPRYFKHLGIYAYRKSTLDRFVSLPESSLERAERLEQLRFLENGVPIYVAETPFDSIGVDTEEDFRRAEKMLKGSHQ
jgi:3-deoxy-manno-octulosonate cytidylyltransferase (CMP-KDO synthetase)